MNPKVGLIVDVTRNSLAKRVSVVLVRTIYPRNVGMAARAMANMGLDRLVLIGPHCAVDEEARQGAAGAQSVLSGYISYDGWDDFHAAEGEGIRIALSRRQGRMRMITNLDEILPSMKSLNDAKILNPSVPIYLFFGPEDHGLNADDLNYVHHIAELPSFGGFHSFNLSHAVLVSLYILQSFFKSEGHCTAVDFSPGVESASPEQRQTIKRKPTFFPEKTIEKWLLTLGFDLSAQRVNAEKILKRILLENTPSESELRVLEAILQQNIRKLQEMDRPD